MGITWAAVTIHRHRWNTLALPTLLTTIHIPATCNWIIRIPVAAPYWRSVVAAESVGAPIPPITLTLRSNTTPIIIIRPALTLISLRRPIRTDRSMPPSLRRPVRILSPLRLPHRSPWNWSAAKWYPEVRYRPHGDHHLLGTSPGKIQSIETHPPTKLALRTRHQNDNRQSKWNFRPAQLIFPAYLLRPILLLFNPIQSDPIQLINETRISLDSIYHLSIGMFSSLIKLLLIAASLSLSTGHSNFGIRMELVGKVSRCRMLPLIGDRHVGRLANYFSSLMFYV